MFTLYFFETFRVGQQVLRRLGVPRVLRMNQLCGKVLLGALVLDLHHNTDGASPEDFDDLESVQQIDRNKPWAKLDRFTSDGAEVICIRMVLTAVRTSIHGNTPLS